MIFRGQESSHIVRGEDNSMPSGCVSVYSPGYVPVAGCRLSQIIDFSQNPENVGCICGSYVAKSIPVFIALSAN